MTTKNKQYEENNIFKIKAKPIEETNYYEIRKIIYIQSRIKGFLFRKTYPSIKQLLLNLTKNKKDCCKIRFEIQLDYLENILKEKFGEFEINKCKTNSSEKIYPCEILIYKNFNSNEEISYYTGNVNIYYMRYGYGKLITKNGIISEGNWMNNKLNGWGRVIDTQNLIIGEGYYTETNEKVMIYQALYGERTLYVRPYDMFMSEVEHDKYPQIKQKYRFEKVEEEELNKLWEISTSFGGSLVKGS